MKKILFSGIAMMAMIMTSCSDRFESQTPSGDMADVTFALHVEGATATRAISDGTGANQLMWAIFTEEGDLVTAKTVKNDVNDLLSENGHTISVSLAKGKTYKATFWAQNSECEAYTVSDDMVVTVDYEGINNDELRDAFFVTSDAFTVEESTVVSVVLTRPFAQVNVGAYPWDLEYAQETGMDVSMSGAVLRGVANSINLFDGSVDGEVEVNYSLSAIPEEKLYVDVDENGENEEYEYLSMSYVLAEPESTLHSMAFTFADAEGNAEFTFESGLGNVPVQRNWRTNIVGQILTGTMSFNIKIDPVYEGETINSGGLYYNFTEDTVVEDKIFAFNAQNEWATFTTENNNYLVLRNVTFSGKINQIAIGEYRGKEPGDVPYTNLLENVTAKNISVSNSIQNVQPIDYMSILFYIRGNSVIKDCTFTGTTTIAQPVKDFNGDMHDVIAYDCGIPNFCVASIEDSEISSLYAWSHSQITLKNTKVDYLRCSTHKKSYSASHLTIDEGTEVGEIVVSSSGLAKFVTIDGKRTLVAESWPPCLIIKAGAKVGRLDMNGRTAEHLVIEEGAVVGEIVNLAE